MVSCNEQFDELQVIAGRRDVDLLEPYTADYSASASIYAELERADFERLLRDLREDTFGADQLWLWELSRGSRQVKEWIVLLDLCVQRKVRIYVLTDDHLYDPANGHDRKTLLKDAVDAEYASGETSRRVGRSTAARIASGAWHGTPPYGFKHEYNKGRCIARVADPVECPVVQEMFRRVGKHETMLSVAADLDMRDIRTRAGNKFGVSQIRDILMNPAYLGVRAFHDSQKKHPTDGLPRVRKVRLRVDSTVVRAQWPALVTEEEFWQVQKVLASPRRGHNKGPRPGGGTYLLSGFVRTPCGFYVTGRTPRETRVYACANNTCVSVNAAELDKYVTDVVLATLARPVEYMRSRLATRANADAYEAARLVVAGIEQELSELADDLGRNAISSRMAGIAEQEKLGRLYVARAEEHRWALKHEATAALPPGPDVRARFEAMTLAQQRMALRPLLTVGEIGVVTLNPLPRELRRWGVNPIAGRVTWTQP